MSLCAQFIGSVLTCSQSLLIQVADLDLMNSHITHLIKRIPKDRSSFDIQDLFFLLTLDSATHFLFGESVGSLLPQSAAHPSILDTSSVGGPQGFAYHFNLAQEYLMQRARFFELFFLVDGREFRDSVRKVHEVVDYYVKLGIDQYNEKKQKYAAGSDEKGHGDERYIFLHALAADTQDPKVLRDNLLNILLAGRDTTASLLSSVFYYLSRNKRAWNRLLTEVRDIFGDAKNPKEKITHAALKNAPYLKHVLNESEYSHAVLLV